MLNPKALVLTWEQRTMVGVLRGPLSAGIDSLWGLSAIHSAHTGEHRVHTIPKIGRWRLDIVG